MPIAWPRRIPSQRRAASRVRPSDSQACESLGSQVSTRTEKWLTVTGPLTRARCNLLHLASSLSLDVSLSIYLAPFRTIGELMHAAFLFAALCVTARPGDDRNESRDPRAGLPLE